MTKNELEEKLEKLQTAPIEEEEEFETPPEEPIAEPVEEPFEDEDLELSEDVVEEPPEKVEPKKEKKGFLGRKKQKSYLKEVKGPLGERAVKAIERAREGTRSGLKTVQAAGKSMEKMGDGVLDSLGGMTKDVSGGQPAQTPPQKESCLREVKPEEVS